ncbi:hypothetical protein [Zymobacter palmae]
MHLGKQPYTIKIHQRDGHVYVDLYVNGKAVVLVQERLSLTRHAYFPFSGELVFVGTRERDDHRSTRISVQGGLCDISMAANLRPCPTCPLK